MDKTLLYLSTGSLGVSISFLKEIAGEPPYKAVIFLNLSWSLWIVSIVSLLVSYWFSARALDRARRLSQEPDFWNKSVDGLENRITVGLNFVAIVTFLCGLVLVMVFVYKNLEIQ